MKTYFPFLVSVFTISIFILSCTKDKLEYHCEFVQIDETMDGLIDKTEAQIMIDCFANRLTSKSAIESNLIGEWVLVGHGEGWIHTASQPCGYVTISKDELIFDYESGYYDSVTVHTWEVVELQNGYFALEVSPTIGSRFYMDNFCTKYMFHNSTPVDGNMYIYEKVG